MKRGKSRGQMQISFGMIFSIILVIVFLGFAFYAIKTFLSFKDQATGGKLIEDLQNDVNNIYENSVKASQPKEYAVPSGTSYVCFIDFSSDSSGPNAGLYSPIKSGVDYINSNFAFYPIDHSGTGSAEIDHLDIEATTAEENPLCFGVNNGKVNLVLKKDFGEALVTIQKVQ